MSIVFGQLHHAKSIELGLIFLDQDSLDSVSLLFATDHTEHTIVVRLWTILTKATAEAPGLVLSQSTLKMLLHPAIESLLYTAIERQTGDTNILLTSDFVGDDIDHLISITPALALLNLQHEYSITPAPFIVKCDKYHEFFLITS